MMYITHGVGRLALLILDLGAMRRPDCRDKRGGNYSHAFFVSKKSHIDILLNREFSGHSIGIALLLLCT